MRTDLGRFNSDLMECGQLRLDSTLVALKVITIQAQVKHILLEVCTVGIGSVQIAVLIRRPCTRGNTLLRSWKPYISSACVN